MLSSDVGNIYESNCKFGKSEYSYLQYHWWPMAFTVTDGELISSVKYRRRNEGMASRTRIIAGKIVHTASISWESIASVQVLSFVISINRA